MSTGNYSDFEDTMKDNINSMIRSLCCGTDKPNGIITLDGQLMRTMNSTINIGIPITIVEKNPAIYDEQFCNMMNFPYADYVTHVNGDIFDYLSINPVENYMIYLDLMSTDIDYEDLRDIKSSITTSYGICVTILCRSKSCTINERISKIDKFMRRCGLSIHKVISYHRDGGAQMCHIQWLRSKTIDPMFINLNTGFEINITGDTYYQVKI